MNDSIESAIERSALSKMSRRLLPLIGLSYLIAFMDRANIGFASLQMNADLGFSAAVYGLGAGLFFAGYSLFEIPSNLLLVRFGARRWIARIMFTWGLLSAGMMFVQTPMQFYVMRFLLGVAEAGFFPGVLLYLSSWFPAASRGRAVSRFYIAVPMASMVMGSVAGALLGLDGSLGLAGWQWLLLLEGVPALVMAGVLLRFLPDAPATASWLTAAEKDWIARSLSADVTASGASHKGFVRSLLDPAVLGIGTVLALVFACSNAVSFSGPKILIEATGWSVTDVGFLVACGGLLSTIAMLLTGWHSDRHRERHLHIAAMAVFTVISAAGMALDVSPALTVASFLVFTAASLIVGPLCMVLASESLHPDARPVGLAAVNTIAQVGNFVGPVLWGIAADRTGSFTYGFGVIPFVVLAAIALVFAMRRRAFSFASKAISLS